MPRYVDGFVIPLPRAKVAQYRRIARRAARVWKDHGALDYVECVGEDLAPKGPMRMVGFPRLAKVKAGETVVFSWIVYRSRAHRDRVNAAVMKDPRIAALSTDDMPFDCRRMAWGGFSVLVEA